MRGMLNQLCQMVAIVAAQANVGKARCCAREMFGHRHFTKTVEWSAKWSLSATDQPFYEIHFVGQSLMIETNLLKIVKQTLFGIPETMDRILGKFPESGLPHVYVLLGKRDRVPQATHKPSHIFTSLLLRRQSLSFGVRSLFGSNGTRDRIDCITPFIGSVMFP